MKSVIYYNSQIYNTKVEVVFAGAQSVELAFNRIIQSRSYELESGGKLRVRAGEEF